MQKLEKKTVAVVGANGALGSTISSSLQNCGMDVFEFFRTSQDALPVMEPLETSANNPLPKNKKTYTFDYIILANRRRSKLKDETNFFSVENFIRVNSDNSTSIINLGSYIEFYEINTDAKLFDYQQDKISQKLMLANLQSEIGFQLINLNLFTIYGQKESNNSFFKQIMKAAISNQTFQCSPGGQLISLTHIDNLLECVVSLLRLDTLPPGEFSFWKTPPITLKEVIEKIASVTNSRFEVDFMALPYSGHELFEYDASLFPSQIFPNFEFMELEDGIKRSLENDR